MPDHDLVVGREMKIKLERRNTEIERGFERWQRVFGFETAGSAVSLYIDTGQWLLDEGFFGIRAQNSVVCRARRREHRKGECEHEKQWRANS